MQPTQKTNSTWKVHTKHGAVLTACILAYTLFGLITDANSARSNLFWLFTSTNNSSSESEIPQPNPYVEPIDTMPMHLQRPVTMDQQTLRSFSQRIQAVVSENKSIPQWYYNDYMARDYFKISAFQRLVTHSVASLPPNDITDATLARSRELLSTLTARHTEMDLFIRDRYSATSGLDAVFTSISQGQATIGDTLKINAAESYIHQLKEKLNTQRTELAQIRTQMRKLYPKPEQRDYTYFLPPGTPPLDRSSPVAYLNPAYAEAKQKAARANNPRTWLPGADTLLSDQFRMTDEEKAPRTIEELLWQ